MVMRRRLFFGNALIRYFIVRFSSVNYCLFLILKFWYAKVNSACKRRIACCNQAFFLLEVVVALALSLCMVSFFGLSLGQALFNLRYQRDRLTALCCARSALHESCIKHASTGAFYKRYGNFDARVTSVSDSKYPHCKIVTSSVVWPDGTVALVSGTLS